MKYFTKIFFFISILFPSSVFAAKEEKLVYDKEIVESSKCVTHFKAVERKHKIPSDILHSISLQESGKKHEKLNKIIPWPWSVNVEGKGYYFKSKIEAAQFVRQQRSFGKKSIDVGCMQINLHHHAGAFDSVNEALDPKSNIEYGAQFLREKYNQYGSWKRAIANYHSANNELGSNYRNSVLRIASNIDKHKFDYLEQYNSLNFEKAPKVSQKNKIIHFNGKRRDKYRSNMMVHIPKAN